MSFCEAEEEDEKNVGNRSSSVKWGRELLLQVKIYGFLCWVFGGTAKI